MGNFEGAVEDLLALEGRYVNDVGDPGGETNFGISKRSYPELDIKNLTREHAIEIYRRDWWLHFGFDRIHHPEIAAKVFVLAVHMGINAAVKCLQRAINGCSGGSIPILEVDGVLGPKTLAAVNHQNIWLHVRTLMMALLRLEAIKYYLEIGTFRYLAGWIRRALA